MDLTHSVSVITTSEDNFVHSKSTDLIKPKDSTENVHHGTTKEAAGGGGGEFKSYKRRWAVLILFAFYSASNAMQWIQYSIINNIIIKYYQINDKWVDWTSMIYMILYIPLIFPGSWFLDKFGLRITALVGVFGTCIGSWIKVFSVSPDAFFIGFIGQSVVAFSQVFVLSLPARVAAVWFGPDQVSSACSVGVFGNQTEMIGEKFLIGYDLHMDGVAIKSQLGIAVGFVLPPMLVGNHEDLNMIGSDLKLMFYMVAGLTSVLVVLMVLFFQDHPPTPPSAAQEASKTNPDGEPSFMQSLKNLILNPNYILLLLSYGINVGVFYAISTLLNPVVLTYYPGHEVDCGRIGLCIVLAGMLGSVVSGVILDKTHKFKETTLAVYAFSMIGMWIFTFTLNTGHIAVVYITASLLGFFMTGYLPVGFEFAAELTYPEPEGTSAGLLNAAAQVFGIAFTMGYSFMLDSWSDVEADIVMSVMLVVGTIVTATIKSDLKRQAACAAAPQPTAAISSA